MHACIYGMQSPQGSHRLCKRNPMILRWIFHDRFSIFHDCLSAQSMHSQYFAEQSLTFWTKSNLLNVSKENNLAKSESKIGYIPWLFIKSQDVLGDTSKFTTESHEMLQGDVGELFPWFLWHITKSHYYHLSVVLDYYIGLYRQLRQFCETSSEVANYVFVFCETMWKPGATEIEFWCLPLPIPCFPFSVGTLSAVYCSPAL